MTQAQWWTIITVLCMQVGLSLGTFSMSLVALIGVVHGQC